MKDLKEIVEPLIRWFRENKRDLPWRQTKDPYAVWVFGNYAPADES